MVEALRGCPRSLARMTRNPFRFSVSSVPASVDSLRVIRKQSEDSVRHPAAFFTSALILASSAGPSAVSAKAVGHIAPSSRCAESLKPNVA